MSTKICPICCDDLNPSESYYCTYCGFKVCMGCQLRHMTESLDCMDCKYPSLVSIKFSHEYEPKYMERILKLEESFMLHTRKEVKQESLEEEMKAQIDYFSSLGCSYARSYLSKPIDMHRLVACQGCGDISYDDGYTIECSCGKTKCSKCKEDIQAGHSCDENTVLSFANIKESAKHCPGCGIPIFKHAGCYQVMCSECSCVFDYNTGNVDKGFIHTPEMLKMVNDLVKESKLDPIDWVTLVKEPRVYMIYSTVIEILGRQTSKMEINRSARINHVKGLINSSEYKKKTKENYLKYYSLIAKAKDLIKQV